MTETFIALCAEYHDYIATVYVLWFILLVLALINSITKPTREATNDLLLLLFIGFAPVIVPMLATFFVLSQLARGFKPCFKLWFLIRGWIIPYRIRFWLSSRHMNLRMREIDRLPLTDGMKRAAKEQVLQSHITRMQNHL